MIRASVEPLYGFPDGPSWWTWMWFSTFAGYISAMDRYPITYLAVTTRVADYVFILHKWSPPGKSYFRQSQKTRYGAESFPGNESTLSLLLMLNQSENETTQPLYRSQTDFSLVVPTRKYGNETTKFTVVFPQSEDCTSAPLITPRAYALAGLSDCFCQSVRQ